MLTTYFPGWLPPDQRREALENEGLLIRTVSICSLNGYPIRAFCARARHFEWYNSSVARYYLSITQPVGANQRYVHTDRRCQQITGAATLRTTARVVQIGFDRA